jgi:methionyl aminopeptidase
VGIREFKIGNRVEDVGNAIQKYTESHGYGVVRELVGHGGQKCTKTLKCRTTAKEVGKLFVEGMVVALEPMINQGTRNIKQLKDGGHFNCRRKTICTEHDIALVDGKPNYYLRSHTFIRH